MQFSSKISKSLNAYVQSLFYEFQFQKINTNSLNFITNDKNIKNWSSVKVQSKKMTMKFWNFEFCNFPFTSVET